MKINPIDKAAPEKENIFEKLVEELNYEERLLLKTKLESILKISDKKEIKRIEEQNEKKLQTHLKNYKISFLQKLIFYILSFFKNISYSDFLINKIEQDLKSKLSKTKPYFYKKSTDTITLNFYNIISEIYEFYYKYNKIIDKFNDILDNEDDNKKFIFYLVKNNLDKQLSKKFNFFERENLKNFILKNKDYKNKLFDYKKVMERELSYTLKEKINPIYNFIYSFFRFFRLNFNQFFNTVRIKQNPTSIKVKTISFFLIELYKSINLIPVEDLDKIDILYHVINNFYDFDELIEIDKDDFEQFFTNVAKLQSSKSLELLLKVALSNPMANYPAMRYNIDIKKGFYSYFDKYFKEIVFDLENEIRIEKKQSVYNKLEEEGFEYYRLKHLNKDFINFLKKYSLPSLNNFESFYILSSFYYTKWQKEFRNMLQNLIAFKYYVLPSKQINRLNDLFLDIDNLDYDLNSIDNETQKLILNIKETFKNMEQLSNKSLISIIQAEISKIDILIENFNKLYYEKIVEVVNILSYNKSDPDVLKLLTKLEWWENIFRILFF